MFCASVFYGFLFLFLPLLTFVYFYGKRIHSHFENTGIKYIKPRFPFTGNNIMVLLGREHMTTNIKWQYNMFPDQKYIGTFEGSRPTILLRDPELIKSIGIKEFDTFHDHRTIVDETDDMFGKTLFGLKGMKWRDMRATLSPAFSSSKMRNMLMFVERCAEDMSQFFLDKLKNENKEIIEIEAKDTFSKYTVDTIATSAFGIEINSLKNDTNEFYTLSKMVSTFSLIQTIKLFLLFTFPKICKFFRMGFANPKVTNFFERLVTSSMRNREQNNIVRPDMIHLLMEAKKGKLAHDKEAEDVADTGFATVEESEVGKETVRRIWSDDYLAAQAFSFFLGGFDTNSNFLSFFFYEMIRQPEIQKKVQKEIDQVIRETGDKFAYNSLTKLKYLDMCVSETLRVWPLAPAIDRQASKDFRLPSSSERSEAFYELKAGQNIMIPIYALQHDPQYFSNPEKFDPERFSDENKGNINPGTYLPFGIGPRNCIGSRYALMVVKAIIFHILSNFDVVPTAKTEIPIKFAKIPFTFKSENGIWLGLKKRNL